MLKLRSIWGQVDRASRPHNMDFVSAAGRKASDSCGVASLPW